MRGVLLDRRGRPEQWLDPREVVRRRGEDDAEFRRIVSELDRARELSGPFEPRGSTNSWTELIRTEVQDATAIANTAAETLLVPALTMPARYLMAGPGRSLRMQVRGRYSTTATPTLTFRLRIGSVSGVVVCASAAYTTPTTVTNVPFVLNLLAVVRSVGSAGTMFGMGDFTLSTAAPNTLATQLIPASAPAVSGAIDMTAAQDVSITATWGTANAANTIQAHLYTLEACN